MWITPGTASKNLFVENFVDGASVPQKDVGYVIDDKYSVVNMQKLYRIKTSRVTAACKT